MFAQRRPGLAALTAARMASRSDSAGAFQRASNRFARSVSAVSSTLAAGFFAAAGFGPHFLHLARTSSSTSAMVNSPASILAFQPASAFSTQPPPRGRLSGLGCRVMVRVQPIARRTSSSPNRHTHP